MVYANYLLRDFYQWLICVIAVSVLVQVTCTERNIHVCASCHTFSFKFFMLSAIQTNDRHPPPKWRAQIRRHLILFIFYKLYAI